MAPSPREVVQGLLGRGEAMDVRSAWSFSRPLTELEVATLSGRDCGAMPLPPTTTTALRITEDETGRVVLLARPLHLAVLSRNLAVVRRLLRVDPNLARERCRIDAFDYDAELTAVQCVAFARGTHDLVRCFVELGIPVAPEKYGADYGSPSTQLAFANRRWVNCQTIHLAIDLGCLSLVEAVLKEQPQAVDVPGHFRLGGWSYAGVAPLHLIALKCGEEANRTTKTTTTHRLHHQDECPSSFDPSFYFDVARLLLEHGADVHDSRCAYSWRVYGGGVRLVRLSPVAVLLLQLPNQLKTRKAVLRFVDLFLTRRHASRPSAGSVVVTSETTSSSYWKKTKKTAAATLKDDALALRGTLFEEFGQTSFESDPSTVRVYETLLHFAMFHCRSTAVVDRVAAATCAHLGCDAVRSVLLETKDKRTPFWRVVDARCTWAFLWPKVRLTYVGYRDPHSIFSTLDDDTIRLVRDYAVVDPITYFASGLLSKETIN
mmetsp:Transcript_24642/g.79655  ORF Transcript_24642/g.79655 Transcript_24642/m.79655 type:complete len:489 (-) Transcript_24642:1764-3230(-)